MKNLAVLFLAASGLLVPGGARALEQAGVSAAVRGSVELSREQVVGRQVESGESLYLQDSILSGVSSGMQILLLDETVFTLGADSEIVIDEFVYDPTRGGGQMSARVVKGAFRFVTGKVARGRAEDMQVRLPAGTIGIRGTIVAGLVDPSDSSSLVVLLGPGRENDASETEGWVEVSNAGQTVDLRRPNFATRIPGAGLPPTPPFRIPRDLLDLLNTQLSAGARAPVGSATPPVGAGGSAASAAEQSGAATARGGAAAGLLGATAELDDSLRSRDTESAQSELIEEPMEEMMEHMEEVLLTIARVEDLATVTSGVGFADVATVPLSDGGSYDFNLFIDFGLQELSASFFNITLPSLEIAQEFFSLSSPLGAGRDGLAIYEASGAIFDEIIPVQASVELLRLSNAAAGTPPSDVRHALTISPSESPVISGGQTDPISFDPSGPILEPPFDPISP